VFIVAAGMTDAVGDGKDSPLARSSRANRNSRTGKMDERERNRFFLAKAASSNSVPELGKEFATEPEAIVESLKTNLTYFTVSEWRGVADFSGKKPELKREAVLKTHNTG
jgi:hypothetical protein